MKKRCNRCHRSMKGTTAYDGACECGGLIEAVHEAYGYEPPRFVSAPCGWGQRFPNLSAANDGAVQHMAECSQDCSAYQVEDLKK